MQVGGFKHDWMNFHFIYGIYNPKPIDEVHHFSEGLKRTNQNVKLALDQKRGWLVVQILSGQLYCPTGSTDWLTLSISFHPEFGLMVV